MWTLKCSTVTGAAPLLDGSGTGRCGKAVEVDFFSVVRFYGCVDMKLAQGQPAYFLICVLHKSRRCDVFRISAHSWGLCRERGPLVKLKRWSRFKIRPWTNVSHVSLVRAQLTLQAAHQLLVGVVRHQSYHLHPLLDLRIGMKIRMRGKLNDGEKFSFMVSTGTERESSCSETHNTQVRARSPVKLHAAGPCCLVGLNTSWLWFYQRERKTGPLLSSAGILSKYLFVFQDINPWMKLENWTHWILTNKCMSDHDINVTI